MAMKMKTVNYVSAKHILAIPDHYVALGYKHAKADVSTPGLATLVEGRYIVKAGTIFTQDSKAVGIVLNDYDVTDSDAMMAVVVHGFIKEAALPVSPNQNQRAEMKLIHFVTSVQ